MGRKKKDKAIILQAAQSWLDELEGEIVPNVLTKEERKSYGKQARQLRGALGRHSGTAVAAELEQSAEPVPAPGPAGRFLRGEETA